MLYVKGAWRQHIVEGCKMYEVIQILKMLKAALKKYNQDGYSNIQVSSGTIGLQADD